MNFFCARFMQFVCTRHNVATDFHVVSIKRNKPCNRPIYLILLLYRLDSFTVAQFDAIVHVVVVVIIVI